MICNYFAMSCHLIMSLSWCPKVCRAERKQWSLMELELGLERSQLPKPVGAHHTTTGTGALSTSAVTHSS